MLLRLVKYRKALRKGRGGKMASNWYHEFQVQMSWEVVTAVTILLALAYLIGRKSIQYVSARVAEEMMTKYKPPKAAPHYEAAKAEAAIAKVDNGKVKFDGLKANSTVMVFRSSTFDNAIAAVFASIFACVFASAHINGMIQFFINHLSRNDGAVWGDILAYVALVALTAGFFALVRGLLRIGQVHTVVAKSEGYLAAGYRPAFFEKESVGYIIATIAWLLKREYQRGSR